MVGTRYNVCGAEREKERERKRARHKGCCTEKERKRESKAQRVRCVLVKDGKKELVARSARASRAISRTRSG